MRLEILNNGYKFGTKVLFGISNFSRGILCLMPPGWSFTVPIFKVTLPGSLHNALCAALQHGL